MAQMAPPPRLKPLVVEGIDRKATKDVSAKSPRTAHPNSTAGTAKVRLTLEAAWNEAEKDFFAKTGRSLMTSTPGQKKAVLDTWQQKYEREANDKNTQRYNKMVDVLSSVVNGLEVVGAFAAQAASMAFAPAGMCFNAIAFLIDAPRQIKTVYDTLKALFDEVNDFLIKFKIYRRIDNSMGLDPDLIENTNRVLICFVRICALSIKLLEGSRFLTAAKVVFLKDDSGVSDELKSLQELSRRQDQLAGTVTLEHVMKSEADVKQILTQSGETNLLMRSWVAANNDERNKMVNQERLRKIERKLFSKEEAAQRTENEPPTTQEDLLPETLACLESQELYKRWREPEQRGRTVLFLQGATGTGKTRLFEALKENLDLKRQEAGQDDPLDYVAFHTFKDKLSLIGEKSKLNESFFPYALRSMAFQIAQQSTTYAKLLEHQVQETKNISKLKSIEDTWSALQLFAFSASPGSSLFLFFDAIDQELETKTAELLDGILNNRKRSHDRDLVNIRVLLTGFRRLPKRFGPLVPELTMDSLNTVLVKAFIEKELKRLQLLQDPDKKTTAHKANVMDKLPNLAEGSFEFVKTKIERLHQAFENDSPSDKLMDIITATDNIGYSEESKKLLNELQKSLSIQHVQQLNHLLIWLLYSRSLYLPTLSELEAALYLHQGNDTLEPLAKKCRDRFSRILYMYAGTGCYGVKYDIADTLRAAEDDTQGISESQSLISMDITIKNARENDVRKFFWDLNDQLSSGKFDFSRLKNQQKAKRIYVNRIEAHTTLSRLCLKLLNNERIEQTEALIPYALEATPRHLKELVDDYDKISDNDKKLIMQGLINFLSDPHYAEHEFDDFGSGEYWLSQRDDVEAVHFWLTSAMENLDLQPRERRWVAGILKPGAHRADHLQQVALAVGRKWTGTRTVYEEELFTWLEKYLDMCEASEESDNENDGANHISELPPGGPDIDVGTKAETQANLLQEDSAVPEIDHPAASESINGNGQVENESKEAPISSNGNEASPDDLTAVSGTVENDVAVRNGEEDGSIEATTYAEASFPLKVRATNDSLTTIVKRSTAERVQRVADWVQANLKVGLTFKYLMNLGYTYYDFNDHETALGYWTQAKEYPDENQWRVFIAMGRAYREKNEYEKAAVHFEQGIEAMRLLYKEATLSEADVVFFYDNLMDVADIYERFGKTDQGIPFYEEALKVKPTSVSCRFKLLEILCKSGRIQHAMEFMEEWSENPEQRPSDSIYSSLETDPDGEGLVNLIHVVTDEKAGAISLRALLIDSLSEAMIKAKKNSQPSIYVSLLCMKARATAMSENFTGVHEAVDMWEEVTKSMVSDEFKSYAYLVNLGLAARCASVYKFDQARSKLLTNPSMTQDEKNALSAELVEYIDYTANANPDNTDKLGLHGCEKYLAVFYFLVGNTQSGREYLEWDLRTGTEVLSDDDENNDGYGIGKLMHVLMCAGDRIGALTAFSLFDRRGRSSGWKGEKFYDDGLTGSCDLCGKYVKTCDADGVWYCRLCPATLYCLSCYGKVQDGTFRSYICHQSHEFWRFYHTDYTEEEIAHDKVRINWELEDKGNGEFARKGGQIVELRDWLNMLRKDWGIPELDEPEPVS